MRRDAAFPDNNSPIDTFSNADGNHSSSFSGVEQAFDSESMDNRSEDGSGRSPHGSPPGRSTAESPSQVLSDPHFEKSSEGDAETDRYRSSQCLVFMSDAMGRPMFV